MHVKIRLPRNVRHEDLQDGFEWGVLYMVAVPRVGDSIYLPTPGHAERPFLVHAVSWYVGRDYDAFVVVR